MTDQSKRRRDDEQTIPEEQNEPGPSTKLRRHDASPSESDEGSDLSSSSSQAEVTLPDPVRRFIDFDEWGTSSEDSPPTPNASGTEKGNRTPILATPELSETSMPHIDTPTGFDLEDFTDFSDRTSAPSTPRQPVTPPHGPQARGQIPDTTTVPAGTTDASRTSSSERIEAQRTERQAHRMDPDAELTDGYITETDMEMVQPIPAATITAGTDQAPAGQVHEWTPPPKRQRMTPSTAGRTGRTMIDDTDDSEDDSALLHTLDELGYNHTAGEQHQTPRRSPSTSNNLGAPRSAGTSAIGTSAIDAVTLRRTDQPTDDNTRITRAETGETMSTATHPEKSAHRATHIQRRRQRKATATNTRRCACLRTTPANRPNQDAQTARRTRQ